MVFQHGFGIKAPLATKDIDLAIQISNWDEFEELKKGLIDNGQFTETRIAHTLEYNNLIPIDIVPFGEINEKDSSISWPPDHDIQMNVLGFDDAFNDAMLVRLKAKPELDILVVSPTSLVALKLIAWKDRAPANTKDAIDLIFIIRNYLDIGNNERLFEEHPDLVDDDFDYVRTGARLLGRDLVNSLEERTITALNQILDEQTIENDKYLLVEDMSRDGSDKLFEENLTLLKSLRQGIIDVTN